MVKLFKYHMLVVLALLLAGCTRLLDDPSSGLLESKLERKSSPFPANSKRAKLEKLLQEDAESNQGSFDGFTQLGDDQLTGKPISKSAVFAGNDPGNIKLNLA